jgi:3-deoxy-manno-octulosonate cytidylyltransferase (CMP-KDO synthetase)
MSSALRTLIAIPARYDSTRLPGKPLLEIGGLPMIVRVWRRCCEVRGVERVLVATESGRIRDVLEEAGAEVRMTSPEHRTGTDRIAEAVADEGCDVIVNVQGDEPFIDPREVEKLLACFQGGGGAPMATLAARIQSRAELFDPAVVKVVTDRQGDAIYFSRLPVPFHPAFWEDGADGLEPQGRGTLEAARGLYLKHLGVYAYRREFLMSFTAMERTPAEKAEGLEQLRAIENGEKIQVVMSDYGECGVDTPGDLERARRRTGGE